MALNIKNPEADQLARRLAALTGEKISDAVLMALKERLVRESGRRSAAHLLDDVARMQERIARLPKLDLRTDHEILGYDDTGLPR